MSWRFVCAGSLMLASADAVAALTRAEIDMWHEVAVAFGSPTDPMVVRTPVSVAAMHVDRVAGQLVFAARQRVRIDIAPNVLPIAETSRPEKEKVAKERSNSQKPPTEKASAAKSPSNIAKPAPTAAQKAPPAPQPTKPPALPAKSNPVAAPKSPPNTASPNTASPKPAQSTPVRTTTAGPAPSKVILPTSAPRATLSHPSVVGLYRHYLDGKGTPVTVNFGEVDVSVRAPEFAKVRSLIEQKRVGVHAVSDVKSVEVGGLDKLKYGHIDVKTNGTLTINKDGSWSYRGRLSSARPDTYNFDASSHRGKLDEFATTIGRKVGNEVHSAPFKINFVGEKDHSDDGR